MIWRQVHLRLVDASMSSEKNDSNSLCSFPFWRRKFAGHLRKFDLLILSKVEGDV